MKGLFLSKIQQAMLLWLGSSEGFVQERISASYFDIKDRVVKDLP